MIAQHLVVFAHLFMHTKAKSNCHFTKVFRRFVSLFCCIASYFFDFLRRVGKRCVRSQAKRFVVEHLRQIGRRSLDRLRSLFSQFVVFGVRRE